VPDLLKLAIMHDALVALPDQFLLARALELAQRVGERALEQLRHVRRVAVRATHRLADDAVDQAQRLEPMRGDAQRLGGLGRLRGALPQDRGAALGRDHRVDRVLQHQRHVAHRDRQRAARAALADHRGDDRHLQRRHLVQVAADRLGLVALLGADAGKRAWSVDEGEHRQFELLGELHQPQRLAVALGPGHAEVAVAALLGVAPFLVPDHHHRLAVEARRPADDRRVVGVLAIAVQFVEVGEDRVHVVERVGPLRMARDHCHLPRRELGVGVLQQRVALLLQPLHLFGDVDRRIFLCEAQRLDFLFEVGHRLLEVEKCGLHQYSTGSGSRLRHRYQVATVRHGRQASPIARASSRVTLWPSR